MGRCPSKEGPTERKIPSDNSKYVAAGGPLVSEEDIASVFSSRDRFSLVDVQYSLVASWD